MDCAQIFTVVSGGCFPCYSMESLLGAEQVSSCQTTITAQKRLNFLSDRWIVLKFLQEFLEAFFLTVDMKSLLCEPKVRSRQTRVTAQKGSNF
jgi:sulfur relay (sulfurtransferase) DsrC/TusE family protein